MPDIDITNAPVATSNDFKLFNLLHFRKGRVGVIDDPLVAAVVVGNDVHDFIEETDSHRARIALSIGRVVYLVSPDEITVVGPSKKLSIFPLGIAQTSTIATQKTTVFVRGFYNVKGFPSPASNLDDNLFYPIGVSMWADRTFIQPQSMAKRAVFNRYNASRISGSIYWVGWVVKWTNQALTNALCYFDFTIPISRTYSNVGITEYDPDGMNTIPDYTDNLIKEWS